METDGVDQNQHTIKEEVKIALGQKLISDFLLHNSTNAVISEVEVDFEPEVIIIDSDDDLDNIIDRDRFGNRRSVVCSFADSNKQANQQVGMNLPSPLSCLEANHVMSHAQSKTGIGKFAFVQTASPATVEISDKSEISRSSILQECLHKFLVDDDDDNDERKTTDSSGKHVLNGMSGIEITLPSLEKMDVVKPLTTFNGSGTNLNSDINVVQKERDLFGNLCDNRSTDPVGVSDSTIIKVFGALDKPKLLKNLDVQNDLVKIECPESAVPSGNESDDGLPCFLGVSRAHKTTYLKLEKHDSNEEQMDVDKARNDGYSEPAKVLYSIDQILAEHNQLVKLHEMVSALNDEPLSETTCENPDGDDLRPEDKNKLEKINIVENKICEVHPGKVIFVHCQYQTLFCLESLTLRSCGFQPGHSYTDQQLSVLSLDDLFEFLDPEFIELVFPAISCKSSFLTWIFYLLSLSPDSRSSHRLHQILHDVIHKHLCEWVPSVLDICRVLVNYGASLFSLCEEDQLLNLNERDLRFLKKDGSWMEVDCVNTGFKVENLKMIIQILTDAVAVKAEKYSLKECLVLMLILLQVSLDTKLSEGELHLDFEHMFSAIINALPTESWNSWVQDLCKYVTRVTDSHHNAVYLVGLMPLVERGAELQRILSLMFLQKFIPTAVQFDDLLVPKVVHSLRFLNALSVDESEMDLYLAWSIVNLLEYSIGAESLSSEVETFQSLIKCLQQKISKIKDYVNKVDHIVLKDQMVLLVSKWNIMARTKGKKEIFAAVSASVPIIFQSISSHSDCESDESNSENVGEDMETDRV